MNWYNKIKTSSPLVENNDNLNYLDIGHDVYNDRRNFHGEMMWFIYNDYSIKAWEASYMEMHQESRNKFLASGRYDPDTQKASLYVNIDNKLLNKHLNSPTLYKVLKNKLINIIDRKFGNPEIIDFTKGI